MSETNNVNVESSSFQRVFMEQQSAGINSYEGGAAISLVRAAMGDIFSSSTSAQAVMRHTGAVLSSFMIQSDKEDFRTSIHIEPEIVLGLSIRKMTDAEKFNPDDHNSEIFATKKGDWLAGEMTHDSLSSSAKDFATDDDAAIAEALLTPKEHAEAISYFRVAAAIALTYILTDVKSTFSISSEAGSFLFEITLSNPY